MMSSVTTAVALLIISSALSFTSGLSCHERLTSVIAGTVEYGQLVSEDSLIIRPEHFEKVNRTHFRACICEYTNCLRKCCNKGEVINGTTQWCHTPDNETLDQDIRSFHNIPQEQYNQYPIIYGDMCPGFTYPLDHPNDSFFLMSNGNLNHSFVTKWNQSRNIVYNAAKFCTENNVDENQPRGFHVYVCFVISDGKDLYRIFVLVSIPFLVTTFLVYSWIEELRTLPGKNLMSYIACLTLGYSSYAAPYIFSGITSSKVACQVFGIITHFAFIAAFFWLNIMSYDIWRTFSGKKGFTDPIAKKKKEQKTFMLYCAYGWTGPLLISATVIFIDLAPFIPKTVIKPEFGLAQCWIKTSRAMIMYYFGPVAILLFCNSIFFALSFYAMIFKARKNTAGLKNNDEAKSARAADKMRFLFYTKIFLLNGINWIMEVVAWYSPHLIHYFYASDVLNTLQGVIIFLFFVCNDGSLSLIKKKLGLSPAKVCKTDTRIVGNK